MKKKQDLLYGGVGKDGKPIVSGLLETVVTHSVIDPKPLNRKSRRAYPKLVKKLLK